MTGSMALRRLSAFLDARVSPRRRYGDEHLDIVYTMTAKPPVDDTAVRLHTA